MVKPGQGRSRLAGRAVCRAPLAAAHIHAASCFEFYEQIGGR